MLLGIGNSYTQIEEATESEMMWLRTFLAYETIERGFRGRVKNKKLNTLIDEETRSFPSGLLWKAVAAAKAEQRPVKLIDRRLRPCEPTANWIQAKFLQDAARGPFQREAVQTFLQRTRGIIKASTGFGKTQVAIAMALALPCRIVFLVDEIGLLSQTAQRFDEWNGKGEIAGVIGDNQWNVRRFTVATYQTLESDARTATAAQLYMDTDCIIADECHVVGASTRYKAVQSFLNAYWRAGFSATPFYRNDHGNLLVEGALGRIICEYGVRELVPAEVVVMPEVFFVPHREQSLATTYDAIYSELITHSVRRNALLVGLAKRVEKPGLLFVKALEHGKILEKLCKDAGIRAQFVFGEYSVPDREALIERLKSNDLDLIIVNKIFHKGIDITTLRSIIIGGSGKSVIDSLQRVGRGMRIALGKSGVRIFDIWDGENDTLLTHSSERRDAYRLAHFPTTTWTSLDEVKAFFLAQNNPPSFAPNL